MSGSDPVSANLPFVVRFSAVLRGYWGQTFLAIDLRGKSLRRTKVGLRLLFECSAIMATPMSNKRTEKSNILEVFEHSDSSNELEYDLSLDLDPNFVPRDKRKF